MLSTGVSTGAKALAAACPLTTASATEALGDRRSNRRHFTDEQKLAIVMEAEAPGVTVTAVARRHDIADAIVSVGGDRSNYDRHRLPLTSLSVDLQKCTQWRAGGAGPLFGGIST